MAGLRHSLRVVPDQTLGGLLRQQRFARNMTQTDLGKLLGVRQQTIGTWERGDRPQARFFGPLAEFLGVSVSELEALITGESVPLAGGVSHPQGPGNESNSAQAKAATQSALSALVRVLTARLEDGDLLTPQEMELLKTTVQTLDRYA